MEDFRPETFSQFVKTQRPVWFLVVIWFAAAIALVVLFITSFRNSKEAFWTGFSFGAIGLSAQALFIYYTAYSLYSGGRTGYLDLKKYDLRIFENVGLLIKGFNLMSKKSPFDINIKATIYRFDEADIIIGHTSMILLGKSEQFGTTLYAAPVEIMLSEKLTSISSARVLGWKEENKGIVVDIKDDFYTEPFKLIFRNYVTEIKSWLLCASKATLDEQ